MATLSIMQEQMNERLTRRQIAKIARLHSALTLLAVDMFTFAPDTEVDLDDQEAIIQEIQNIASQFFGTDGRERMLSSIEDVVNHVKQNFK